MNAFKAYDIRGVYNRDFNKDDVYKVGFFIPRLLKTNKVLIGRDVRTSSIEIFEYLCKGITDSGADVYNTGLATTPMIYWGTAQYGFDASVMITASHNPKEYNGLKVSASNALPVGYDSGLSDLEQMVLNEKIEPVTLKGKIIENDFRNDYLAFQKEKLNDISNLNIAVDVSNGMAGLFIRDILGDNPHYIFEDLDGTFPNHEANPLKPENIVDAQKLVEKTKADIGVIFDGDADRVMFVDENSRFISPDLMIAFLANHFLKEKKEGVRVLQDIRTSKAVGEYIAKFNGEMHMWRVGRAYAALKLREIDGLFGGELAGHYYFKEFFYSDSGLMAASLILNILSDLKKQGISLSEAIAEIEVYKNSGEINFKIEKKQEAMDAVIAHFKSQGTPDAFYDFDGYRIEFADWWLNIRPSNTEPYLRFLAEAKTTELLDKIVTESTDIIKSFS
ncbi:MAG: phosphomannomutase/phosphoglucomutase [Bacteroidales bacterium]|nr:phosphomannomutase/phosphoglucomutase [Bacteroidales bacterium]